MKQNRSLIVQVSNRCPCYCPGCYNITSKCEISSHDLIAFVKKYCQIFNASKITLSGGDPLLRNDIEDILEELLNSGIRISIDTVGVTLMKRCRDSSLISVLGRVDYLGLPLDGISDDTICEFRRGLTYSEAIQAIEFSVLNKISVCVNTVVHAKNINEIGHMASLIARNSGIKKWQLFQYMPIGPGGSAHKEYYSIHSEQFENIKGEIMRTISFDSKVEFKSLRSRKNQYLLIGSDGLVWIPQQTSTAEWNDVYDSNERRLVIGSIYDEDIFEKINEVLVQ